MSTRDLNITIMTLIIIILIKEIRRWDAIEAYLVVIETMLGDTVYRCNNYYNFIRLDAGQKGTRSTDYHLFLWNKRSNRREEERTSGPMKYAP